jgi:hypothetical protein
VGTFFPLVSVSCIPEVLCHVCSGCETLPVAQHVSTN